MKKAAKSTFADRNICDNAPLIDFHMRPQIYEDEQLQELLYDNPTQTQRN